MRYSLNEIIERLSLHKYLEKMQQKKAQNYKEIILNRLFDIDYNGAPSGRDSFFRGKVATHILTNILYHNKGANRKYNFRFAPFRRKFR